MLDSLFPNPDEDADPQLLHRFAALCADISERENLALQARVLAHVDYICSHPRSNEFLDVTLAQEIADRLTALLQSGSGHTADERRLRVGAARYFIADEDEEPDTQSILGLDDDLAVFNHVAAQLGEPLLRASI